MILNIADAKCIFCIGEKPAPLTPFLKSNYPEIKYVSRVSKSNSEKKLIVNVDGKAFAETKCLLVDSSFVNIFDCKLISGSFSQFSKDKEVVILTEKIALKYFNSADVIGKSIRMNDKYTLRVIAVIKDIPQNSHLLFDMLIPFIWVEDLFVYVNLKKWRSNYRYNSYIKLKKNVDVDILLKKIISDVPNKDEYISSVLTSFYFQPLKKIHLYSKSEIYNAGINLYYLFIYLGIAIVILISACINYMNLLSAMYLNRVKEVGVRIVIGATQNRIRIQFMSESILFTFLASFLELIRHSLYPEYKPL